MTKSRHHSGSGVIAANAGDIEAHSIPWSQWLYGMCEKEWKRQDNFRQGIHEILRVYCAQESHLISEAQTAAHDGSPRTEVEIGCLNWGPGIALPLEDVVATQRKPILWYGGSDARSELNATYTALAQYEFKFPLPTTPFLDSFTRRFSAAWSAVPVYASVEARYNLWIEWAQVYLSELTGISFISRGSTPCVSVGLVATL